MLTIVIPATEMWDEVNQQFIYIKEQCLHLEHSLVSVSKWESKWCKPFLTKDEKSKEEIVDYIKCMNLTPNVDDSVFLYLSKDNMLAINKYIEAPMTATWFSEDRTTSMNNEQITSELIYYWMIALNIPSEYQKWHLNRLLTLIRVCNVKNQPSKKLSSMEVASRQAALNAERKKKLNTKG